MKLPIINLQKPDVKALDLACRSWGAFALTGHNLTTQRHANALLFAREFFAQNKSKKNEIRRTPDNMWGFYDAELTKNKQDWKEILDIGPPTDARPRQRGIPQWPDTRHFKSTMTLLSQDMHQMALQLVGLMAQALGTRADLPAAFDPHSSFLRLNHYPPCPNPASAHAPTNSTKGELGISHHTDAGAITILLTDQQPGLQIFRDSRWHTITPPDQGVLVNLGDIAQVWSNDRYCAPPHRVLAHQEVSRLSIPYFLNPSYDYDYAPLGSVCSPTEPPRYHSINWGEFRRQRSLGDYADCGEEVQIAHYIRR